MSLPRGLCRRAPLSLAAMWLGMAGAPACSSAPANANPASGEQAQSGSESPADPGVIDTAAAKLAISGGALVIDVRTQKEFDAGVLPQAQLIPYDEIGGRLGEVRALLGDDTARKIVVYCRSGRRSGIAARELAAAGLTVINGGGFKAMSAP